MCEFSNKHSGVVALFERKSEKKSFILALFAFIVLLIEELMSKQISEIRITAVKLNYDYSFISLNLTMEYSKFSG